MADSGNPETRNSAVLAEFTAFCVAHPELRFWQALAVWSESAIIISDGWDTFHWERGTKIENGKDLTAGVARSSGWTGAG